MLLASCGESAVVDGKRLIRLAGNCYRIPEWNALPSEGSPVWPGNPRSDHAPSLTLQFSDMEVARAVPGYRAASAGLNRRLLVGLFVPTAQDSAQRTINKKRAHYDIWYGLGDYSARTLEPVPDTGLIRVYPLAGGDSWMVVTRVPDTERRDSHLRGDFWIATCSYLGAERARTCSADIDVGPFVVSLNIAEAELQRRQQIAEYAVQAFNSWRVVCKN
jgi:hypothetical protein